MQHIHIVNQRRSSTQRPNIRGALQCGTSKMLNEKRSLTQVPNIRGTYNAAHPQCQLMS